MNAPTRIHVAGSIDFAALGWRPDTVGELDHRLLRAPTVKLRGARRGPAGDTVYSVDLRLRKPNADARLSHAELHSLEHFLLEGFQRLLPRHFVGVGVMGCRTGFYLTLLNQGRRSAIERALARVLQGVLVAVDVPYANVAQCGDWQGHDLAAAQRVAREVLAGRDAWRVIA